MTASLRPRWATSTEAAHDQYGRPVVTHYSNEPGEATLLRDDHILTREVSSFAARVWLGGECVTTQRLDAAQIRRLVADLASLLGTLEEFVRASVDSFEDSER